jgi:thioredoxin 1
MHNEPIHVTDEAFERAILQSDLPVVVDFWAPWCGPCKMVAPILEKFAQEYAGKVLVAKVNTDENPQWAGKFGIQGIPTMLFFFGGKMVHQQIGAVPEPYLPDH